jgi:hypothetical protein
VVCVCVCVYLLVWLSMYQKGEKGAPIDRKTIHVLFYGIILYFQGGRLGLWWSFFEIIEVRLPRVS